MVTNWFPKFPSSSKPFAQWVTHIPIYMKTCRPKKHQNGHCSLVMGCFQPVNQFQKIINWWFLKVENQFEVINKYIMLYMKRVEAKMVTWRPSHMPGVPTAAPQIAWSASAQLLTLESLRCATLLFDHRRETQVGRASRKDHSQDTGRRLAGSSGGGTCWRRPTPPSSSSAEVMSGEVGQDQIRFASSTHRLKANPRVKQAVGTNNVCACLCHPEIYSWLLGKSFWKRYIANL